MNVRRRGVVVIDGSAVIVRRLHIRNRTVTQSEAVKNQAVGTDVEKDAGNGLGSASARTFRIASPGDDCLVPSRRRTDGQVPLVDVESARIPQPRVCLGRANIVGINAWADKNRIPRLRRRRVDRLLDRAVGLFGGPVEIRLPVVGGIHVPLVAGDKRQRGEQCQKCDSGCQTSRVHLILLILMMSIFYRKCRH